MTPEMINTHVTATHRMRWPIGVLLGLLCLPLLAAPAFNTAPARAALVRLLPKWQAQITLVALPRQGPDRFRISGTAGHIVVAGTSPAVILTGVEAYLTRVAHVGIGWPGNSLSRLPAILSAPPGPITSHAVVPNRYALNDTDDGYANAYMGWNAWQHKIDLLALHGFNEVFVPIGTAAVYRRTFQQFGYSGAELDAWIPAPGHQPWFLLGNLTGFDAAALTPALYARRVALAQKIVARLRALGMTPVLPGYFGLVPPRFAATHPGAHVVAQGLWNGFRRPDWLDPRSPEFARIASTFYREQRALLGVTSLYRMSLMQEGGRFGDVPPGAAAHAVMAALQRAHPGAVWVMLGWGKNPEPAVLASVDRKHLFILDGVLKDWRDVDYAFGTIPNMGGQRTLGAPAAMWLQRFRKWLHEPGSRLRGIAWLPEASGIDPAAFDLFADLAWTPVPHAAGTCAARQSR